MRRTITCFAVLISIHMATAAYAADDGDLMGMSLQDLMNIEIFSASKFLQKASEAPASITIVTADDIQQYGHRNINDVLRSVPGLYITSDRNYSYIGARGFARPGDYNSRLLLLVNGRRLNDNIYDSVLAGDESIIDIDLISRVEVIRGPSSSLYGTSAFFGIVNIVTKTGADLAGTQATAEAMSNGKYKGRVSAGNKFRSGFEYLFSASVLDSHGYDTLYYPEYSDPATNFGIAEHNDAERNRTFFASFLYKDFSAQVGYGSRKKVIPTGSFDTVFNTDRTFSVDGRTFADFQYDKHFAGNLGLSVRLMYERYRYEADYLYDYSEAEEPFLVVNRDKSRGDYWGTEVQITKQLWAKHRFTAGSEYRNNFKQDQVNYDVDPYVSYLDDDRRSDLWALYVQDEYAITKDLILNAGLRHDHYESFGGTTNPRVGLIYGSSKRTTVKALYGQAFRAPNVYELYYQGGTSASNPFLEPESIRTFELVLEHSIRSNIRIGGSAYDYRIKNLITQQEDLSGEFVTYENAQKINAKGLELQVARRDTDGIQLQLSYAVQRAYDAETRAALTNSPIHMAKISLAAPFIKNKLFAGLETSYMSGRKTITGEPVGGFMLSNITLFSQRLVRNLELSAGLYNIFGKRYADPAAEEHRQNGIEQDGRTFRVKVAYHIPFSEDRR